MTKFHGFLGYFSAVMQTILLNHDVLRLHVKTDRETWDEEMLMLVICNGSREGGGFVVAPDARPDDGLLHYAGVNRVSRLMMLRLVPEVMKGTHGRFRQIRLGELKRLKLESDRPMNIHTDGEIFADFSMNVHRLVLEIMPGELEVLV